eukprot:14087952-Alexandrium_andersonii.AAC.1
MDDPIAALDGLLAQLEAASDAAIGGALSAEAIEAEREAAAAAPDPQAAAPAPEAAAAAPEPAEP